jgi:ankyrin repeat protein
MPAPMLNSVDEELLLSRAWTSEEKSDFYTSLHLTPRKQFSLAAANDDVGRLRLLVEDLAFDCNHRDHEGRTALIWAAKRGHHQAVDILLCHSWDGVDANAQDDCGMTAIMFACRRGDMHMFESLLSLPTIDLMIQENTGLTALMIAIQCTSDPDSIIIVQDLIAYVQARPEYNTTAAKWHPIFNAQDDDGLMPLHWAVEIGRRDCISALLDTERVDVHMRARNGATPAMHAVGHIASSDVLELLFDRNACNPTVTNVCGETLVEVARRQVQEWNVLLDVLYYFPGASEKRGRLQMAIYNLHLCEDYASHYAGLQNQAIGTPVAAGPGL